MKNQKSKIKNQKLFVIIILGSLLFPLVSLAALVPCGGPGQPACQLCHLFVLIDNVIDFVLKNIVLPVALLMIVIGGAMFFAAMGNPEKLTTAKSLITSVVIGVILSFAAWLILGLFFQLIGLADWTKDIYQNWWEKGFFEIPCP